jgi:DNA polymerase elongation subunit (family B)
MGRRTITGWLFDLYPSRQGMTLWVVGRGGEKHRLWAPSTPYFYMHVSRSEVQRVQRATGGLSVRVSLEWDRQREIYSGAEWEVLRVNVHDTTRVRTVVQSLERLFPHYVFFNSDIPPQQLFLYTSGLFPLAFGAYDVDEQDQLISWHLEDRRDALEYTLPDLAIMKIANRPDLISPKYRKALQLEVSYDGSTYSLEHQEPREVLEGLAWHLRRCDPDIILSEYGDAILLPLLTRLALEEDVPLSLNRDSEADYFRTQATSYFSYGRIVHKDGAFELAGRWHLDLENSFLLGEASLDGVAEIARMTQLPVQHQARSTIGSALSSMQLSWALGNGYLIPARKREPEEFKSAATLLLADRGGLIFQPVMGYHEQIAELDFVSMYPTIMVEHNVSPETVNCRCCSNAAVPELQYTICERREGLVPSTLRAVVQKRAAYKQRKKKLKTTGDERWKVYDRRQNALKWMLVTCFGYLGYKNARFGKIEAHETVNAYSRDALLRAKEMAESEGFQFLHAIVDCLWLKKPGATEADYEALAARVQETVGIPLSLEGIYSWILFPSSKMDPHIPTANRYVGYYTNSEIKIRGVEIRRRDTPVFIKRMQGEMLQIMGRAKTVDGLRELLEELLAKVRESVEQLQSGKADPLELVIHRHISREPGEYRNNNSSAVATKALEEAGITLAPGEMVEYIIVDASGRRKPEKVKPVALYAFEDGYDREQYTEMALKAAETLLLPFGYSTEKLRTIFGLEEKKRRRRKPQLSLFEKA